MFHKYDLDSDGFLDQGELCHLVRHLRRGRGESEDVSDIEQQASDIVVRLGDGANRLSMDAWLSAVGTKQIRGTSKLFRFQTGYHPGGADSGVTAGATTAPAPEAEQDTTDLHPMETVVDHRLQVRLAHTAIKVDQDDGSTSTDGATTGLHRAMSETHGKMAVGRVRTIDPVFVCGAHPGVPVAGETETATVVAMRVLDDLLLNDQWTRTEGFVSANATSENRKTSPSIVVADHALQTPVQLSNMCVRTPSLL
eukprot:SAG31_NODE_512_length_14721_cov_17.995623_11_plen_253_part_00